MMVKAVQPAVGLPFKCTHPECNKSFSNQGLLTRHMRIHTGEKPFACEICGKQFSQRGNLSKHLLSHENAHLRWNRETNFKPFKCPHPGCGKSFTAKLNLQNHMAAQHPTEISMGCDVTNVKIEQHGDLTRISYEDYNHDPVHFDHPKGDAIASSNTSKESACLHSGCNLTFSSEAELRSHIFNSTPGIIEEFNFLREMALKFATQMSEWDTFSSQEQTSMRGFARSAIHAIQSIPAASTVSTSTNGSRDVRVVSENGSHMGDGCEERRQHGANHATQAITEAAAVSAAEEEDAWISDLGSIMEDFNMPHYHTTDCMDGLNPHCMSHTSTAAATSATTAAAFGNTYQESRKHHNNASQSFNATHNNHAGEESGVSLLYTPLLFAHDKIATGWEQHLVTSTALSLPSPPTGHGDSKSACIAYHTISSDLDGNIDPVSRNTTRQHITTQSISPAVASSTEISSVASPSACCGGHRKK